jgi:hypothetical protein
MLYDIFIPILVFPMFEPSTEIERLFDFVVFAIQENVTDLFDFMLYRLSPNETTKTFTYEGVEHTLLSFCCSRPFYYTLNPEIIYKQITSLVKAGCQFDQEIGIERKTALSFMVTKDQTLSVVKWCIETMGANPRKGYLLHYACNFISREEREERVLSGTWSYEMVHRNLDMYKYLLSLGLELEECMEKTGLTPLLAVCSEGNTQKVYLFLQVGGENVSLYRKTKEGVDVWFWAEQYKYKHQHVKSFYVYPIRDVLLAHKEKYILFWKEMMEEVMNQSLLQDVPLCDILQTIS